MAPSVPVTLKNNKKHVSFQDNPDQRRTPANVLDAPLDDKLDDRLPHAPNVLRDQHGSLPAAQGLYDPENEKDSCVSPVQGCLAPRRRAFAKRLADPR